MALSQTEIRRFSFPKANGLGYLTFFFFYLSVSRDAFFSLLFFFFLFSFSPEAFRPSAKLEANKHVSSIFIIPLSMFGLKKRNIDSETFPLAPQYTDNYNYELNNGREVKNKVCL